MGSACNRRRWLPKAEEAAQKLISTTAAEKLGDQITDMCYEVIHFSYRDISTIFISVFFYLARDALVSYGAASYMYYWRIFSLLSDRRYFLQSYLPSCTLI
jgi:hypothetical protein